MARVNTGVTRKNRHRKVLKATKGYSGTRSKLFKRANEAYIKSGEHAFAGRKLRKRNMKSLWIVRLSAALDAHNLNYSTFINLLSKSKIDLDRKVLSEMAANRPEAFKAIVDKISTQKA